jgi:hypothetical protein
MRGVELAPAGAVGASAVVSGSRSNVLFANNRTDWEHHRRAIEVHVGTGICVTQMTFTASDIQAATNYWLGENETTSGLFETFDPDNSFGAAQGWNISHWANITSVWIEMERTEAASGAGYSVLYVEVSNSSAATLDPTEVLGRNASIMEYHSEDWRRFNLNSSVTVSPWQPWVETTYYVTLNLTNLHDGGLSGEEDKVKLRKVNDADASGDGGVAFKYNGAWVDFPGKDFPVVVAGHRVAPGGGAWSPDAEAAGLMVHADGYMAPFTGDDVTLVGEWNADDNGNISVRMCTNVSVSTTMSWDLTVTIEDGDGDGDGVPGDDGEEEAVETGRYPDHLISVWEPGPWAPTNIIEGAGYYVFGFGVLGVLTGAGMYVGHKIRRKKGQRVAKYAGLVAVVVYALVLVFAPAALDPLVRAARTIFGPLEYRNWPEWLRPV